MTSTVLFPNADTNKRLRLASAVKLSRRPATLGTGICSSSCRGRISRVGDCAATSLVRKIASRVKAARVNPVRTNNFLMMSPESELRNDLLPAKGEADQRLSGLWFKDKNRGLLSVMRWRRNVIAIEFVRPEGGSGTCLSG